MIHNAMHRLDDLLMWRVFTPIAHWADYRWHVNHFRLASWTLRAGLVAGIAGTFLSWLQNPSWIQSVCVAIQFMNIWITWTMQKRLSDADAAYERDPCTIPRAAYGFLLLPGCVRGSLAAFSVTFFLMLSAFAVLVRSYGLAVQCLYIVAYTAANYFAAIFPSGRARRPKKERAPAFPLEPATAR